MSRFGRGDRVADRFVIEGRLASGGMAEVYVAEMELARGVRRRAAIKRIHPHLVDDAQFVTMFLDEARVSSQLRHPGVIPVHDAVEHDGELLLVMDYVPGWDLGAVLKQSLLEGRIFPLGVVLTIGRGLADTLSYVHSATDMEGKPLQIVHRDVTPSNILLAEDGTTRLLDFGVAKAASRATRTATATLKGKLAYAAPEQVLAAKVSPRTDLYGLGLVIYEMLTGRRAIDGEDDFACLEIARNPKHQAPSSLRPDTPKRLDELVGRLLAKNPKERPASAAEVADELSAIARDIPDTHDGAVGQFVVDVMHASHRPLEQKRSKLEAAFLAIAGGEARTGAAAGGRVRKDSAPPPTDTGVARALPPASTPPPTLESMPTLPTRSKLPWAAGAAVALAGIAGVVWFAATDGGPVEATFDEPGPELPSTATGFLRISTEPPGAQVLVDGEAWEEPTPTVVPSPSGRERRVQVVLSDHEPQQTRVTADEGETVPVRMTLRRTPGRLIVRSTPEGASVTVDGEAKGETPLTLDELPREAVELRVESEGYAPYEQSIPLDEQAEVVVEARLRQRAAVGILEVSSQPWAQVRVDGRLVAESTPATGIRLPAGPHRVTLTNPALGITATRRVNIRAGETSRVVVRLR